MGRPPILGVRTTSGGRDGAHRPRRRRRRRHGACGLPRIVALTILVALTLLPMACGSPDAAPGGGAAEDAPASDVVEVTSEGVRSAFESFLAAWQREDLEAVLESFDPSHAMVVDPAPGSPFIGIAEIRGWVEDAFAAQEAIRIEIEEDSVAVFADEETAYVSCAYTYEFRDPEGDEMVEEGLLTTVWTLEAGSYRMTLFHASRKVGPEGAEEG